MKATKIQRVKTRFAHTMMAMVVIRGNRKSTAIEEQQHKNLWTAKKHREVLGSAILIYVAIAGFAPLKNTAVRKYYKYARTHFQSS